MNKKRIFITGGRGFIGTYLYKRLNALNSHFCIYDLSDGFDIRDKFQLFKSVELFQPDIVIHLAAQAGVRRGEEYPEEYLTTNVMGTKNVVDACEKFNVDKLISFSSSSVVGDSKEDKKETDERTAQSWYGMTKTWGEDIALSSKIKEVIVVRPFTVYGLGGRADQVIYKWINQIKKKQPITVYGDGSSKRGYTHVDDLVEGVVKIVEKEFGLNHRVILNIGGNEAVSLIRLMELFNRFIKLDIINHTRPDCDPQRSVADISLAKELLGWEPKRNFDKEVIKILKAEL